MAKKKTKTEPLKKRMRRKKATPRRIAEDLTQRGTLRKMGPNGGKPPADIDWKKVKAMCRVQCNQKEICAILGISDDTLRERVKKDLGMGWKEFYAEYSSAGKASLRKWQYNTAQRGNPTMQIWLGKNWLGQSDKMEAKVIKSYPWDNVLEELSDDQLELLESIQAKLENAEE